MRMDRFTTLAQEALAQAQSEATSRQHAEVGGLHILAAVLADKASPAWSILGRVGVDPARVLQATQAELSRLPSASGGSPFRSRGRSGPASARNAKAISGT